MFNEEKISKQLVDMKEQTDFMKRFRCALGIALREIKTLRTATENGADSEDATARNNTPSSQSPPRFHRSDQNTMEIKDGKFSESDQCTCEDIANSDLLILRRYLNEIDETGESKTKSHSFIVPAKHLEKTKQDSKNLIERSIAHIERLKGRVENRNALIKKLCQQLSLARLIRVRRETKLEEKLREISELKAENIKIRRSYDKQVIIARSLRGALNSQKQKIQSSESMVHRLDETRKAFESLKSQASHLMKSLRERDNEITELTAKLAEKENAHHGDSSPQGRWDMDTNVMNKNPPLVSQTNQRNDTKGCVNCERKTQELESLKMNYHRLYDDFEYYRRNHPHYLAPESTQSPRDYDQNHPYNRRRMHAPYASPESYRRVSRPPLRRRLNYSGQKSNDGVGTRANHFDNVGDTLLSPIDEFVENFEENAMETAENTENMTTPVSNTNQYGLIQSGNEQTVQFPGNFSRTGQNDMTNKFDNGDSGQYHQITSNSVKPSGQIVREVAEAVTTQKDSTAANAKTSYLELGNSSSPSLSTSSKFGIEAEPEPPLRLNSFIRREDPDELDTKNTFSSENFIEPPQRVSSPQPFNHSFGVIWHPALKEGGKTVTSNHSTVQDDLRLEKLDIVQKPARIQLFGSKSNENLDSIQLDEARGKSRSHYVTYKGHDIDVTNFSIHEFRDIIWSLDGGQESANAFIKFLASTAKKLNASPKWAGKHTMGNPDDWLALRGLY